MKAQTLVKKSHSAAVMPCHTMDKAGKALSLQDSLKAKHHSHEANMEMTKTAVWSQSITSKQLVRQAESILLNVYDRMSLYEARHVSENCWQVKFVNETIGKLDDEEAVLQETVKKMEEIESDGQDSSDPFGFLIPKFNRIRKVSLCEETFLKCSCCTFESRGLPCVHIAVVLKNINPDWTAFSHKDCSLQWWKAWDAIAYSHSPKHRDISKWLLLIDQKQIPGPFITNGYGDTNTKPTFDPPFPVVSKMESIKNYPKQSLQKILGVDYNCWNKENLSVQDDFHTQESYVLNDEFDDEEYQDDEIFAFDGFLDPEADTTGITAKELLKHEVNVMYETLDEYIRTGCSQPIFNDIKDMLIKYVFQMRKEISLKRGVKRPIGNVSYIHDEKEGKKHCKRSFLSRNCY